MPSDDEMEEESPADRAAAAQAAGGRFRNNFVLNPNFNGQSDTDRSYNLRADPI